MEIIELIEPNNNIILRGKIENDMTLQELKKNNLVISLGGGAFINSAIRKKAKKLSTTFWLDVPINQLITRLKNSSQRPLLLKKNLGETVKKIYFDRKKFYNEADYRIKCNSNKSKEIVNKILSLYEKSGNKV